LMPGMCINEVIPNFFGRGINGCTDPKMFLHGQFLLWTGRQPLTIAVIVKSICK
jgi:hypothetical protein